MATPNIIFNIRYRYTQYAQKRLSFEEQKNRINTKDAFEYYDRDEACDKSISTSEAFDYYDYRMGSQGGFNEDGDIGAKGSQELADKYKPEVLYQCVCTFKKDFAIENNIIQKENMKKLIRKSMNPILKQMGFDPNNIVWAAFYHTNTAHPHCHISFYEKEQTYKLHRIPKSKIERVRQEQGGLRKNGVGSMGDLFDGVLQPKSPEMAVIIKENNAEKRNSMYKEYINKIKLKSRNGLKAKIERNIEKQKEIIFKEINNRLEEINSDLKRAEKAYIEVLTIDKNNRKELEEIQAKNQYQYEIYNVLKDEINN